MDKKHPFIWFTDSIEDGCDCSDAVLPVVLGSDLVFQLPITASGVSVINFVTPSGKHIEISKTDPTRQIISLNDDLREFLAKGDCFRLHIRGVVFEANWYSNIFMYVGCEVENTLLFEYWSNDAERFKTRLSAKLYNPNPLTEKEKYTDANAFVHTRKKQRRKQFELEFDFYPESIHDSIQEMLCFPNLEIDGIRYFESGDYRINWENEDERGFAKASTQLSEQEVMQFTNCQ